MPMVALDAARRRIVPTGSIEARWMVDESEVDQYIAHAATQDAMQELMDREAARRLEDEAASQDRAKLEAAYLAGQLERLGR